MEGMAERRVADQPESQSGGSWWYMDRRAVRVSLARVRQHLAERGVTRWERVTDTVWRCWSERAPETPAAWGCRFLPAEAEGDAAGAAAPNGAWPDSRLSPGDTVRIRTGPAAGFVGRVRDVRPDRAVVEILVWGKGMRIEGPPEMFTLLEGLPWDRTVSAQQIAR